MEQSLQSLGGNGFQDLAVALVMAEFGARIRPLGAGADGGRDMIFEGALDWTGRSRTGDGMSPFDAQPEPAVPLGAADVWEGYTVFQMKHHAPLAAQPIDNARWLWAEMRKELEDWTKPAPGRTRTPDHLIFVTNVALSPVPTTGGLAHIEKGLAGYRDELEDSSRDVGDGRERLMKLSRLNRVKHIRVLDSRTIETLIAIHPGVRRNFNGLLTAGDAFAEIAVALNAVNEHELSETLLRHARITLAGDRGITFNEAGAAGGPLLPLDDVAIDLPLHTAAGGDRTLFQYALDRGDRVLRPSTTLHSGPRHLVVAGPMGNGKTTISKLLVQAYRASLLQGAGNLGAPATAAANGIEARLRKLGRQGLPEHRRWPMRVDLATFAEEEGQTETSLVRHIAKLVSAKTAKQITGGSIDSWMMRWPWFLALDGLDEVTEPSVRQSVIRRVVELVADADDRNLDLFVVLTTRPVGYTEEIEPTLFERVDLAPLPIDLALRYGKDVSAARLGAGHEDIPRIHRELDRAAARETTRELMVTPLQVLLLALIIEAAGPVPPDRFALFWGYYGTVAKREQLKPGTIRRLIEEHLPNITILHERLGYELHRRAQHSEHATATMSSEELRDLIAAVLADDGHKPDGADAHLVEEIKKACLQRLVLIRAHKDGAVGFDVRALQELMAGRHLTTGRDDKVEETLRELAADAHWRVPWIFAAGRIFAETQPHRRAQVVKIVELVDDGASWRLGRVVPVGPGLALDLAVDGGARRHPVVRQPLLDCALKLLKEPAPRDVRATARLLARAAGASPEARSQVSASLRRALGGTPTARDTATQIMDVIPSVLADIDASDDVRMLASVKSVGPSGRRDMPDSGRWWQQVRAGAQRTAADHPSGPAVARAIEALHILRGEVAPGARSIREWESGAKSLGFSIGEELGDVLFDLTVIEPLLHALEDARAAQRLEAELADMSFHDPEATKRLRDWVLPLATRVDLDDQ